MDAMISQKKHAWGPILSTHPLGYKELIVRSLRLYFASFPKVILFSFLLAVIVFTPRLLSYILGHDVLKGTSFFSLQILWIIIIDFIALLLMAAMFWRLHCVAHYKHEGFKEDLNVGFHKFFYVFIAVLIQSLIIFGISYLTLLIQLFLYRHGILFINQTSSWPQIILTFSIFAGQTILIFYLFTLFIFLTPLIAIENEHIFQSIKRSVNLTWNHWWRVFSTQLSPWIYFLIFSLIVKYLIGVNIRLYFVAQETYSLGATLLQLFIFALFVIWTTSLLYVQMKDLELRKKAELKATP